LEVRWRPIAETSYKNDISNVQFAVDDLAQTRTQSFLLSALWLWVGFIVLAVHQGKDGKLRHFFPFFPNSFARIDHLPIFQCEKE